MVTSLSNSKLRTLEPWFAEYAHYLVEVFNDAGWPLQIVSGRRSLSHQQALITAGITAATRSYHLSGLAFDVGFIGYSSKSLPWEIWEVVGEFGESLGLRWGGRFSTPDVVHFDAKYLLQ